MVPASPRFTSVCWTHDSLGLDRYPLAAVRCVTGRVAHAAPTCYGQWWAWSGRRRRAPRRADGRGRSCSCPDRRTSTARALARPCPTRVVKGVPEGTGRRSALDHPSGVWHSLGPRRGGPVVPALVPVPVRRVRGDVPALGRAATGIGGRDPGPWAGGPGGGPGRGAPVCRVSELGRRSRVAVEALGVGLCGLALGLSSYARSGKRRPGRRAGSFSGRRAETGADASGPLAGRLDDVEKVLTAACHQRATSCPAPLDA
jgi:hypothetical protein